MNEEWKPVKGLEGLYEVSNIGRVKSLRNGKILIPHFLPNGYARVKLTATTGGRERYIHRLVAEAFCVHPDGCNVVNHIDYDKRNNNSTNLEWTTQLGNVRYSMSNGRMPKFPNSKRVIGIKDDRETEYGSAHEASQMTGCDSSMIIKCCKGKVRNTHGFEWRYAEVIV